MSDPAVDAEAPPDAIHYPDSEPRTVPQSDAHFAASAYLYHALPIALAGRNDLCVAADMFLYYEEGNLAARKAPDILVAGGVAPRDRQRKVFKVWEEGVVPGLVIEITSKGTQREDLWDKRALYERLGVSEYLLFDPEDEYLEPRFQAFRLRAAQGYEAVDLPEDGAFRSATFDVGFRPEGALLRVLDAAGEPVPRLEEAARRAEKLERELQRYRERFGEPDEA